MTKVCIRCQDISKSYDGKNQVVDHFSYDFEENKIYLLLGSSGSGKTTLLNILDGILSFEKGTIDFLGFPFQKKVDSNLCRKEVAYITQNCYFVDYLTIKENLELSLKNSKKEITTYLKEFHLLGLEHKFPNELSGGEKQRVAIIQALLKEQSIIFLDEPTASLDEKNKEILKNILKKCKKGSLILCASHDESMKEIADEVIDLNKPIKQHPNFSFEMKHTKETKIKKKALFPYMMKEFTYRNRERKSDFFLTLILTILFLILFACLNGKEKLLESLVQKYGLNAVSIECKIENESPCKEALKPYQNYELVYEYGMNLPEGKTNDGVTMYYPFHTFLRSLPYEKSFLKLEDPILYGTYYQKETDILVGYEKAQELFNQRTNSYETLLFQGISTMEDLVGKQIKITLPDKEETFTICGILKDFEDPIYIQSLVGTENFNEYLYANGKYLEKYEKDTVYGEQEQATGFTIYTVYFDSPSAFLKFYQAKQSSKVKVYDVSSYFNDYEKDTELLQLFSYPVMIITFFSTILFYFQTKSIQNEHKGYILSIYYSYGYEWKQILKSYLVVSLISILSKILFAGILSIFLSSLFNQASSIFHLSDFKVFQVDYRVFLISLVLIIITIFFVSFQVKKQKKKGWIYSTLEGDDLL